MDAKELQELIALAKNAEEGAHNGWPFYPEALKKAMTPVAVRELAEQALLAQPLQQDDGKEQGPVVFMDEIDAAQAGENFLKQYYIASVRMECSLNDGPQIPTVKWTILLDWKDRIVAGYLLTRDLKNWTQLTRFVSCDATAQPSDKLQQDELCTEPNRADCPRKCIDFCNKAEQEAASATDAGQGRFYMEHGQWHDRVTSQHMWTQDQYDERYRDGLAIGRANTEIEAADAAQATPEGADLPDHPGDGAYPWWSKQEAEAIQKWGAQQRRNGYAEGYDEKLSLLDRLTEQLREARAQLGIMSSKDDMLSRALKNEINLANQKFFFNPSFCNFTPPRDGTYLVSVKGGNCQIDYHAQERAPASSQQASDAWQMKMQDDGSLLLTRGEGNFLRFVPAVAAEPVAWVRRHPDGALTAEFLEHAVIDPVRKNSGAWVPLYRAAPPQQVDTNGLPG